MLKVTIIGGDLAKNVFQLHGAAEDGSVVFRKKLSRLLFERFMAGHPPCIVAMEACAGAHHWARKLSVAFALANKMARVVWAMLTCGEDYRAPALVSAA